MLRFVLFLLFGVFVCHHPAFAAPARAGEIGPDAINNAEFSTSFKDKINPTVIRLQVMLDRV